jgi:hypothetical protein
MIASQNEASIWVSSAPIAARNTPRSRCSSAHQKRSSDLSAIASASLIASRASEVRSARCKASASSASKDGVSNVKPLARRSLIPCSIHAIPSAVSPKALRAQPRKMTPQYESNSILPTTAESSGQLRSRRTLIHFSSESIAALGLQQKRISACQ